ncbi:hypothetical protein BaRGS_00033099 [Batillaria attramentaria]|uniref:CDP-diacylglycerol--inositol 3-phosphatidyltransferase n=1 Tax=Batillaria attramentaria TaxID=370345 RepID=A0ABD0JKZ8_9CAEN
MGFEVLMYVPNVIGYIRILLTVLAFVLYAHPAWFLTLYSTAVILDAFDGYCARTLNQCSAFGAWFDVVVDLLGRGLLWCSLYQYGYLVIFVEWMTFVSTHCRGAQWKITEENFPWLVKRVMANGFKTSWGVAAIGGLHVLPIWLYAWESGFMTLTLAIPVSLQLTGIALLTTGRVICLVVEMFFVYNHLYTLLHQDTGQAKN